jgi:hypothetical protein
LKSQIEGFSSLSSGLTALQGTVASLQSAINNIPVTPATDISGLEASLTSLAAEVTALQTSLASAATAAEVAALSTSLAAVQADLADLLAANNVYSEDILVTNASTLTFAKNLGDKLAIVNGNVTFVVTPEMNIADVQEVANKLVTVTKDVSYYATSSTVAGVTFDNLTSAANIEYSQSSDLKMAKLESAGVVSLASSAKVGIVDFRALASVTSINMATFTNHTSGASSSSAADRIAVTTSAAHTLNFSSATEIHLTALPYYTSGLTITGKLGGVVALTAFASVDADGEEAATNLNITGPAAVTMGDTYTLGTFTASNVETVTLGAHRGNVSLTGVTNFKHANLVGTLTVTDSSDLTTVDITGDFDDVTTASKDKSGPAISLANQTALKTAAFAGTVGAINLSGATNLTTLTVGGTVDSVTLSNNNDLTSVTTSGKIGSFSIDGADDLAELSLAHTTLTRAKGATGTNLTAILAGSLVVTNNPKLASLTSVADALSTLTVTGNALLSSIDFTGLKVVGGATAHAITVSGNALNAEKIVEGDGTTAGATAKVGAFTSASGMSTLKTYLDDAVAETNKVTISVSFDSADTHILKSTTAGTDDTETNNITSGAKLVVMDITATVTTASTVPTIRQTVTSVATISKDALGNNAAIAAGEGISVTALGATASIVGNTTIDTVAELIAAINADTTFAGTDISITAAQDAYSTSENSISFTKADGAEATIITAGNIVWSYGAAASGTVAIAAGDDQDDIAAAIAADFVTADGYEATASEHKIIVSQLVSPYTAGGKNLGNDVSFGNTIAINTVSSTAKFSANASNTAALNSLYFLNVSKKDLHGLRVTVKNNSTTVSTVPTIALEGSGSTIGALTALVSSTNVNTTPSLVAGFADISTTGAATVATGNSVDRTSWL